MFLGTVLAVLVVAWPASEIVLGIRTRASGGAAAVRDRGSAAILWAVIGLSVTAAVLLEFARVAPFAAPLIAIRCVAVCLMGGGLAIRWTAILTLGRFFTSNVAIQRDHAVVRRGLYRRLRHPSYTGLLLTFAGLGVTFGNWLSLVSLAVPVTAAVLYRIRVEERALLEALGAEYAQYRRTTWRLLPGIF
jgi:protein-S-isoprenylcysteine O-methyltransferase